MKIKQTMLFGLMLSGSVILAGCNDSEAQSAGEGARAGTELASTELELFKSPTCGCCESWLEHARKYAFSAIVHDTEDMAGVKQRLGIAPVYRSCHTAVSKEGFVFEGHVPARLVQQFLANPPANALGLAVPGMPLGSPGMEMGDRFTPYPVLLLKQDGSHTPYAEIDEPSQQY